MVWSTTIASEFSMWINLFRLLRLSGGGHYIAYARNESNDRWHCYDDSFVSDAEFKVRNRHSILPLPNQLSAAGSKEKKTGRATCVAFMVRSSYIMLKRVARL
jgi:hypothetical protein